LQFPFKRPLLKVRHTAARYIIIHHTYELYKASSAVIDNNQYQLPAILNNVLETASPDINYHFVIEKIKDDFQVFAMRPFVTFCDFPDIEQGINEKAIHIALLGDYDLRIPEKRIYDVLAYRIVCPLMKQFAIYEDHLYNHKDVSTDKTLTCPGQSFDLQILKMFTRKYIMR
jgi:hypothetical protein